MNPAHAALDAIESPFPVWFSSSPSLDHFFSRNQRNLETRFSRDLERRRELVEARLGKHHLPTLVVHRQKPALFRALVFFLFLFPFFLELNNQFSFSKLTARAFVLCSWSERVICEGISLSLSPPLFSPLEVLAGGRPRDLSATRRTPPRAAPNLLTRSRKKGTPTGLAALVERRRGTPTRTCHSCIFRDLNLSLWRCLFSLSKGL